MKPKTEPGKPVAVAYSESLLRQVIDQIPDVFVLKDEKGDFLLCNQVVARLYGTTPDEMVGKHDDDYGVPKPLSDHFRESALAVMAKGETEIVYEDSRNSETGEIRHFKSIKKPLIGPDGKKQCMIIAQDITDLMRTQRELEEQQLRLQQTLEIIHEGFWDWHLPTGRVTHNDEWYRIMGAKRGDIAETKDAFAARLHPEDAPQVFQTLEDLLSGKTKMYNSEHRMVRLDGGVIRVRDRGRIIERDGHGAVLRIIGSVTDVTDIRNAEDEMIKAKEEAIQASKAKSSFLANMSHELRTPLNAILGFSETMKNNIFGPLGNAKNQEYAELIHRSGGHLLNIISDMLDLSKIEAGGVALEKSVVDMNALVSDCIEVIMTKAEEKNISITVSRKRTVNQLVADRLRTKQMLLNLLSNAVKFTQEHGKVEVSYGEAEDGLFLLSVKDNGIGIPEAGLEKALSPFEQLHDAEQGAKEGTGLGLSITKQLIDLHGGQLVLESDVGKGTTVSLIFPKH